MRVAGAGVLCYSEREDGAPVLLLGREKETLGWRQGSNKWSGFSGRVEPGEDACLGAAREFVEESLAAVPLEGSMRVPVDVEEAAACLRRGAPRVEFCQRPEGQQPSCHVSFVKRVPYADYARSFAAARDGVLECDRVFRAYHRAKKVAERLPRLLLPGYRISPSLTVVGGEEREGGVELRIWDEGRRTMRRTWFGLAREAAREWAAVYQLWRVVVDFVAARRLPALEHPAVSLQRVQGELVGAYVNKCYLEKSEVRWWPLEELEGAVAARPLDFRRFFAENATALVAAVRALRRQGKGDDDEAPATLPEGTASATSATTARTASAAPPEEAASEGPSDLWRVKRVRRLRPWGP